MKKLLLITLGAGLSFGAFAQRTAGSNLPSKPLTLNGHSAQNAFSNARTTAVGSVDTLSNLDTGGIALYYAGATSDTGFSSGTDFYGDQGFAERYDINGADSSVKVTGVLAIFGGTINPASTKSVVFNVWSVAAPSASISLTTGNPSSFWFESGYPNAVLTSVTVPLSGMYTDSLQVHTFTTPSASINNSFFVGYTISYNPTALAGDTIGVYTTVDGNRTSPTVYASGTDTIINNMNVTQYSDGSWNDNATSDFGLVYDYFMLPIVLVGNPSSVQGVTRNSLTFYGNYPNPATDNTNIKFSLANNTDVTIVISDMAGRTVNTISETNLAPGMHIIPVATGNMTAGDYIYYVRTASGDGMASKLTIAK